MDEREAKPNREAQGADNSNRVEGSEQDEFEVLARRPRRWPWVIAMVALLAGGGAGLFVLDSAPDPKRVLVAVNLDGYWWEGSEASATVTDVFATRLEALGFEVVKAGDPKVMAVLESAESPQAAAKELGAGFVVTADLKAEMLEHPITPTYYEGRVSGIVLLSYGQDAAATLGTVNGWSGSSDAAKAKALLGKASLDAATAAYETKLEERLKGEEGQNDQKYHGKLDEDVVLGGITEQGFLSQVTKIRPFYDPASESLRYYRDTDALYWTKLTGERSELTRAYNLYGYPATTADGGTVVLVEDIFGWAKAINVIRGNQPPARLRVDPDHRYSSPQVAPAGGFAAFYDKPCQRCLNGILVIELAQGKTVFKLEEREGEPYGFSWLDSKRLLLVWKPVPTEEQEEASVQGVYVVDVSAKEPHLELLQNVEADTTLVAASVDHAGKRVAFGRRHEDGRGLAILELDPPALTTYDVGGFVSDPVLSPNGASVAFEQNDEIVHYGLSSGARTELTRNAVRDRYPSFAPDGQRIYYESWSSDPNFPKERNVSVVCSVKTP
jgi:hypothetical protein